MKLLGANRVEIRVARSRCTVYNNRVMANTHKKREALQCAQSYLARACDIYAIEDVKREVTALRKVAGDSVAGRVIADNLMRKLREYDVPERLVPSRAYVHWSRVPFAELCRR